MANADRTIARDSVFSGIGKADEPALCKAPRRKTDTYQTAVWLGAKQLEWLDSQCQQIRRGGWRSATRSALIRALIEIAVEEVPELVGVSDEDKLKARLASCRDKQHHRNDNTVMRKYCSTAGARYDQVEAQE